MKVLIVARHGEYNEDSREEELTPRGRDQVRQMAASLADRLRGKSIVILTSPAQRAMDTTTEIVNGLGVPCTLDGPHDCLWSGGGDLDDDEASEAMKLVERVGATHEVVILSTHWEFMKDFPAVWGKSRGLSIPSRLDAPRGRAWVIDAETGAYEMATFNRA